MGFKYTNSRTAAENDVIDYLNKRLDEAHLYFAVYDDPESLREIEVLPSIIASLEGDDHRKESAPVWVVEPQDLEEYNSEE